MIARAGGLESDGIDTPEAALDAARGRAEAARTAFRAAAEARRDPLDVRRLLHEWDNARQEEARIDELFRAIRYQRDAGNE